MLHILDYEVWLNRMAYLIFKLTKPDFNANGLSNLHVSVVQDRLRGRVGDPRTRSRRRGDPPHDRTASRPFQLSVGLQVSSISLAYMRYGL